MFDSNIAYLDIFKWNVHKNFWLLVHPFFLTGVENFGYLSGIPFIVKGVQITPVKSYLNAGIDKKRIYDENKNKVGIYCWTNLTNNNCYVGSSSDLRKRLSWYFRFNHLNKLAESSVSLICRALLKYGYSKFRLDILEYCDANLLIDREQYYIDLLKPKYNILLVAGSSLGYKHSKDTIAKLIGRNLSLEHLTNLKKHLTNHNTSAEQWSKAKARMLKINEYKRIGIEVLDTKTKETTKYSSIHQPANAIGCSHSTIVKARKVSLEKGIEILIKRRFIIQINK